MKTIIINSKVYGNKAMLVDDEDYELISKRKWALQNGQYAQRQVKGIKVYAHRIIMGNPESFVDHIDGNTLNNQTANLRLANSNENARNCKIPVTNKTGYKGVCFAYGKFLSGIYVNNKRIHIGTFNNAIEAAIAYNEAAIKHHGEFARLNQIPCAG